MGAQHSRELVQNDRLRQQQAGTRRGQPGSEIQSFTKVPTGATDGVFSPTTSSNDHGATKKRNPFKRHSRDAPAAEHITINPVRHQVVLSEQALPLSTLASASKLIKRNSDRLKFSASGSSSSPTSPTSPHHQHQHHSHHHNNNHHHRRREMDAISALSVTMSDDDEESRRTYPSSSRSGHYSSSYDSTSSMQQQQQHQQQQMLGRSSYLSSTSFGDTTSGQFVFDLISQPSNMLSRANGNSTNSILLPVTPPPPFMPPPKTPLPPNPPSPPLPKPNSWVFDHSEEKEYNRQLRQHYVMKQVLGGKTRVSLDQAERILDIGCGIGLWVWEASQQYADTEVIGMDIHVPDMQSGPWAKHIVGRLRTSASNNSTSSFASSLNGKDRQVPGHNISFMYADFLKPFPYDDASFDFVHAQDISWYVPMQDWPALISQFHRIIKPNGLLQVIEHDGIFKNPGPALVLINEWHQLVAKENEVDLSYCPGGLETELRRAGMDVLETQTLDIPIGEWPNELVQKQHGFLYKEQIKTKFRSVQRWWLTAAGISSQQYDKICMEAMDEFDQYQTSVTWTITVARKKPLDWAGSNNTQ